MFRFVSSLVLLLLSTTAARAFEFGAPVPLTNSLYGTLAGEVRLASNGEDVFAFWASHGTIRAKVYYENESRVSRSVMTTTATSIDDFDVLWTGTQFLVVATHDREIRARLLDRDAFTYGGEFAVGGLGTTPRLTFNGKSVLLAHRDQGTRALLVTPLSARGEVLAPATRIEGANPADFAIASNGDGFAVLTTRVDCTFFDNTGRKQSTTSLASDAARRVTIASDGARYFAAWFTNAKSFATTIDASGSAGPTLTFDETNRGVDRAPASVWTGSDYVVAYATDRPGHTLRVQHFNRDAALTSTEPERFFDQSVGGVALLAHRGTTWLAWNPTSHGVVERLPLQHVTLASVPYGQAEQTLLAAATSATQTLVVWKENVDARSVVRSGVRSMSGSWREESVTLARDVERGVAASNANGFVAVVSDEVSGTAVRFSQAGVPLAPTIEIPFAVTGIVASGNGYVLAGLDLHSAIVVARLDASGVLSAPVNVPMSGLLTSVAIA
ncbi:MAG TPA: hypothetical protein VF787_21890, partial [Thermoanaerobaculia bacterium]